MENAFVSQMTKKVAETRTENGAYALNTTGNELVDLFATIGALRTRSEREIIHKFEKAYAEDALLATKMIFYARNIRGGLGERRTFRVILRYMAVAHTKVMRKNLEFVPVFGRWDDLYVLVGTPLEKDVWSIFKEKLAEDVAIVDRSMLSDESYKEPISLLAKWLKSENASNSETVGLAKRTMRGIGMNSKEYRKTLSRLRKYLEVVETKMTAEEWGLINYSAVTSKAMTKYRNAFMKHDKFNFENWIRDVQEGKKKINASTLYPYDILEAYNLNLRGRSAYISIEEYNAVLEEQWKALPNYIEGENNVLVMADTSRSMEGRPINTALGLAVYFAERNKGAFANKFMTFSKIPSFVDIKGTTLSAKLSCIPIIVENTNIEAALQLILKTAKDGKVPAKDMPKALVIISDMEFDYVEDEKENLTYYEHMVKEYNQAGYKAPKIIYWNVASRQDTYHADSDDTGALMVSGQSVSTFKIVLDNIIGTMLDVVIRILSDEMYSMIQI